MKTQHIAEELVKLIRKGDNKQAKDLFYADHIISIEGNGDRFEGIEAIKQKSINWAAQVLEVHSALVSDPLVAADHFSLHIQMDISYKNGHRATMDEIAVYEVKLSGGDRRKYEIRCQTLSRFTKIDFRVIRLYQ